MKKKIFGALSLLLAVSSCSLNSKFPIKIGDKLDDDMRIIQDDVKYRFDYIDYMFFEYKKQNYVIHYDPLTSIINNLHSYHIKKVVENDFKKIDVGMSIYEVVELVGLPFDSNTSGLLSMNFKITDSQDYRVIYFIQPNDSAEDLTVSTIVL